MSKLIEKMEKEGLIEDSHSPWSVPMVIIPQKATGDFRICIDYRKLNLTTIKSAQNLPRINSRLDALSSAK